MRVRENGMIGKASPAAAVSRSGPRADMWEKALAGATVALFLFLSFYNLTAFPVTWFDEGSHLHVPKTLVRFGVYADYSSEGFRHYGPTIGVGPTVMLPIAAVFKVLGIGLGPARAVMALYLLAAAGAFFLLARHMGGARFALVASGLLVTSRGVGLLEYGRQVLGEVPGLFFMVLGFWLWFEAWERAGWRRLAGVGLLFGLATVTKQQYLLVLAPTLLAAWVLNLIYFRSAPQRVFLAPGIVSAACFTLWQLYLVMYLGPATTADNLAQYREFTSGAALVFSTDLMLRALAQIVSPRVFLFALIPAVLFQARHALPRTRAGHQWAILCVLIVWNLIWYVVASVSWVRYAFPALAVASLFVARAFFDLTDDRPWDVRAVWAAWRRGALPAWRAAQHGVLVAWLAAMIAIPLAQTGRQIVAPPSNAPRAMADYLDANVERAALIETWEPEIGFLTDHNYHYPPQIMLNTAVKYMWQGGPPPAQAYDFVQTGRPDYVLVGKFARWVGMYPADVLADYELVTSVEYYDLYAAR